MSLFEDEDNLVPAPTVQRDFRYNAGYKPHRPLWSYAAVAVVSLVAGALLTLLFVPFFLGASEREMSAFNQPAVPTVAGGGGSVNFNDQVVRAAEKVNPTVVSVINELKSKGDEGNQAEPETSLGSGVIFEKRDGKALIVTNNHVVQDYKKLEVVLSNGEHRKASLVGSDTLTDLAVLVTDGDGIDHVASFGESDQLKAGQAAIAIGNPLGLGFSQTITVGVISSPQRTIAVSLGENGEIDWEMDVIQTDAAINQGNSGGALVDLDGNVIGINSMKVADMGVEGLGFAIPIDQAKPVIQSLLEYGKVKRPYIGIRHVDLQVFEEGKESLKLPASVKTGVVVIEALGPAKDAGLKTNDVIVELDGRKVEDSVQLRKYLYTEKKIGDEVDISFYRDGHLKHVTLKLGELKE